jgi:hypothetical protein
VASDAGEEAGLTTVAGADDEARAEVDSDAGTDAMVGLAATVCGGGAPRAGSMGVTAAGVDGRTGKRCARTISLTRSTATAALSTRGEASVTTSSLAERSVEWSNTQISMASDVTSRTAS